MPRLCRSHAPGEHQRTRTDQNGGSGGTGGSAAGAWLFSPVGSRASRTTAVYGLITPTVFVIRYGRARCSSRTKVCLEAFLTTATLCLKMAFTVFLILRHGRIRIGACTEKPSMKERFSKPPDRRFYLQGLRAVGLRYHAARNPASASARLQTRSPLKGSVDLSAYWRPLHQGDRVGPQAARGANF